MKSLKLFAVLAVSLLATVANASVRYADLSDDEKTAINNGEQVVKTEDVEGSVWPSITVFQRVEATPDQVAGVMFDYPLHKSIFEGITKSEPKKAGAAVTEIDYTMTFPKVLGITLPDENYTVLDKLSGSAGNYSIDWTFVRASTIKDCSGSAKFDRLGNGTLVSYTNFINPPRPALAKLIVNMAITRVQDTVKALDKQVQAERGGDSAKLTAQIAALNKALGR